MKQRKKIVAGNWKMNTGLNEATDLVKAIVAGSAGVEGVERIVFPPFPYLETVHDLLKNEKNFYTGAQNCSEHEKGAYTGEVSAAMLSGVGSKYVLIGHSERRTYFYETGSQLKGKISQCLNNDLNVILCIGEKLDERKNGKHFTVVETQIREALEKFPDQKLDKLILAYEPVWAIGTGETASPAQAQEMHAKIREIMGGLFGRDAAGQISILYGGSCNAQNAPELFACADVDGGLIGGASLKAADFCSIIKSF